MSKPVWIIYLCLVSAIVSVFLHNLVSGLLHIEEPVFFTLAIGLGLAFIPLVVIYLIIYLRTKKPADFWLVIVPVILFIGVVLFLRNPWRAPVVTNFTECTKATKGIILETYPAQCKINGQTFIEDIGNTVGKAGIIKVTMPVTNQSITSPLTIVGEAVGSWFFEGSFPVELRDANNKVLVSGQAQASGNWMTDQFVPFEAQLEFTAPAGMANGVLILRKDNPSGKSELDDSLSVPIKFGTQ